MISTTAHSPVSETGSNGSSGHSPKHLHYNRSSFSTFEAPVLGRPMVVDSQAPRACEKCRASKRKCDKKLPFCDRCKRLNAKCHYTQDPSMNGLNGHGVQVICYQPHSLTNDGLLQGAEPLNGISASEILALIPASTRPGEPQVDWRTTIDTYFACVHPWYAVVHPVLFEHHIANLRATANSPESSESRDSISNISSLSNGHMENHSPMHGSISSYQGTPDLISKELALLVVAMYLITRMRLTDTGERQMFDETYRAVKRMLSMLLVGCIGDPEPSIELLQCASLIALYEYGHGEAVTSYRTLGHAVTMANFLDIKPCQIDDILRKNINNVSDLEEEQNHSIWWGMFILEQFIHQDEGGRHLPFLLESPSRNTLLPETPPMSPVLSSAGKNTPTPPRLRHLSTSVLVGEEKFGQFQLSAKVSSLLHRALQLDKERNSRPGKMPLVESYRDLDVEIRKTTSTMIEETLHWELALDCFSMLISSLFVLYLPYLPLIESMAPDFSRNRRRSDELETALAALRFACKMSTDISCKVNASYQASKRSPVVLCAPAGATCYLVIIVYASFCRIFPEESNERQTDIAEKFESLRLFSSRWGIAERMMRQLERTAGLDRKHYLKDSSISPPTAQSMEMEF
ncbi:hypothetical protein F5B20DRAFT_129248 [Whalleya microplaca]|nr:hypothetical protein F5B20DRAFT_129248 [Whalleya microplaca]